MRQLEPFIELLRPNLSWGSKRMRLAARAAISRRQFGPEWDPDNRKLDALNDVDDSSGPHALIPGSHHSRSVFRFFNRQLPDNIAERLGTPRTLTGPAGMCFFEDTIIYHRGVRPTKRPRVILQVQFGLAK